LYQPLPKLAAPAEVSADNFACDLDPQLTNAIQSLARSRKVSLKTVYLTSYLDLIARVRGQETATAGVVSNGRTERLSEPFKSLGLFWNIVPVYAPVRARDKLAQLARVQQLLIDIEPHARYPLTQILADQAQPELFFATLNFLHFHNARNGFDNSGMKQLGAGSHDKFHFPLNLAVAVNPDNAQATLRVEYDQSYFNARAIEAIMHDYIALLQQVTEAPQS